jgi:hypothetical protein
MRLPTTSSPYWTAGGGSEDEPAPPAPRRAFAAWCDAVPPDARCYHTLFERPLLSKFSLDALLKVHTHDRLTDTR